MPPSPRRAEHLVRPDASARGEGRRAAHAAVPVSVVLLPGRRPKHEHGGADADLVAVRELSGHRHGAGRAGTCRSCCRGPRARPSAPSTTIRAWWRDTRARSITTRASEARPSRFSPASERDVPLGPDQAARRRLARPRPLSRRSRRRRRRSRSDGSCAAGGALSRRHLGRTGPRPPAERGSSPRRSCPATAARGSPAWRGPAVAPRSSNSRNWNALGDRGCGTPSRRSSLESPSNRHRPKRSAHGRTSARNQRSRRIR